MKKAKVNVGDVVVNLPVEYLDQQTAINSVFDNVPVESVDIDALIEANKHGVNWYFRNVIGEDRRVLYISIPTELIKWEE